jgi:LmbE family N-acetylglucosaminyl deacetylase
MHRAFQIVIAAVCLLAGLGRNVLMAEPLLPVGSHGQPVAILQDLHSFSHLGSVLMVAAHPDDENTQLITYLSLGRGYRMGYLSITRGDGGQNLLGPEFGAELGVIRTQELLAARRIDGGQQFFTRAIDFGFSKDYRETLGIWDHQAVLSDIVRVIRTFRPDVMVTRFSTVPGNTHGHHTASAILAVEAFKLAGDPKAFPEQLTGGIKPWQPKRILYNGFGAGMAPSSQMVPGAANTRSALRIDISGTDPVSGESFGTLAARSRSQHKTQGFGDFGAAGRNGGSRPESFQLLDGVPASKDIMDGVDLSWAAVKGGDAIIPLIDEAIAKFNPQDPSASVPALLAVRAILMRLPTDPVVTDKRRQLDRILAACLGLTVETTVPDAEACPGETLKLTHTAIERSDVPVRWMAVKYPGVSAQLAEPVDLKPGQAATRMTTQTLPAATPLSQPYWLREPGTAGMFRVDDAALIGRPENPPAFPVEQIFEVGGQTLVIADQPVEMTTDPGKGETRRRMEVIPPVSLNVGSEVELFAPGATHSVEIQATAFRADIAGTLQLEMPDGWNVSPATLPLKLSGIGDHASYQFEVSAPAQPAAARITARVRIGDRSYDNERVEIRYSHIPPLLLQPPAVIKTVALNLAVRGQKVGYIDGAGDSVADALRRMGYAVTELNGADLTPDRLKDFDAIVIGIRAMNVRKDLGPHMNALFDYVAAGGNVIEQYNRPNGLQVNPIAPYELRLSSDRVTDENSVVKFLAPDHPALNTPNKITSADFDGWVQERGIYFPDRWDSHFTPILSCGDPGEAPLDGGLLIAHHGKGYFVYTGLVFFRQLPAGNPGAYRLFANLVSLGK